MGDIDGDGFSDVVTTQKFWVGLGGNSYNPQNYTNVMKNSEAGALNQVVTDGDLDPNEFLGDFNGDGRTDLFDQNSTSTAALFSNGDGTFTSDGGDSSLATGTLVPADFDGDGCTDMLAQGASNLIHYFCSPATTSVSVTNFTGSTIVLGDFNGDGKSDLLVIGASAATIYLSTGTGFTSGHTVTSSSSWHNYKVMAGDWDGDGRADVVLLSQASGTAHTVFLSTGTDFTQVTTISNSDTSVSAVVADWNNDGGQDFWMKKSSGDMLYTFAFVPEAMTSISNGIGATTTITYDRLNKNGSLYAKGTATYPQIALDGPVYVVSQVSASNGIGGSYTQTFAYSGAFGRFATTTYAQAVGGHTNSAYSGITSASTAAALFGFAQVVMTDSQTTIVQTTNYRTDFPYVGRVSSQTSVLSGVTLRSVSNTWAASNLGGTRNFVSLSESVVSGHDANGATLPTTTTDYTYDSYGNALTITASVSDGSSSTTTNTFTNDTTHWILGELATASVDNVVGSSNITRSASFAHDSTSGLLTQTIVEPSNCEYKLQTDYTLDGFGNRTAAQVSGAGCSSDSYRTAITTRTNDAGYDTAGEFQTSTTNALSQADSTAFSASFGAPTSHTDLNSHTTSWSYDSFGRMTLETRPDSTKTAISFAFCSGVNGGSASCPTYGAYLKQTEAFASNGTTQIGPIVTVYFDALNRVIAQDMQAYDGSVSRTATVYDSYGRVSETSRPYFVAINSPNYTVNTYDALGRVTRQDFPNSSGYYTMSYNGLTVSKTNDHSQTTSTTLNAQGQPASVVDAASHTTSYVYDAFGRLLTVTDPSSNTITNAYDLRGNKTDSYDPDMGHWTYVSDVLGELKSQVDAKSQTTTLTYDLLGRPTERGESGLVSDWVYDGATYGVGLPQKACTSASSNSTCTSATTTR
ncbi:MAG TPA: FG-GAP-like repeat-containing protein, partial [Rhizomicrobium sp.]